ncbi:hypothetical protein ACRPOS_007075 [Bartonella heixiaziensis]|uniref:hypothetical protein n=1 Tax=Bartonella heixiaziensis TaxID=1461000 RepID=UPI003908916D
MCAACFCFVALAKVLALQVIGEGRREAVKSILPVEIVPLVLKDMVLEGISNLRTVEPEWRGF